MCLLAIQYRLVSESPILVAANREESYERVSSSPSIQSGKPRVLCGVDQQCGGTWLGVNQHGMFAGVCNRPKQATPASPRSRGLLCRDLLRAGSARKAVDMALEELSTGNYDGANFVVADSESGWAIHAGDDYEVVPLEEGLNIVASGDVNDPRDDRVKLAQRLLTLQTLDSPVKFLAVASKVFARPPAGPMRPGMVVRDRNRGTVSSTLLALGLKPRDAIFQYSAGAPDQTKYEDFSPLLRDILSRGLRESRAKAKAT
ncbi:MAG: NRDE family protein [Planctomycetes bacterium]|nr:NRDE family protein [Planctomycetota bacterium]